MIAEELWNRAVEVLQRNAVHTPASCVHGPYTKGPNPAGESCRVYPLSPNLPDHKNPLRGVPGARSRQSRARGGAEPPAPIQEGAFTANEAMH